jgi:hypothetical protein
MMLNLRTKVRKTRKKIKETRGKTDMATKHAIYKSTTRYNMPKNLKS